MIFEKLFLWDEILEIVCLVLLKSYTDLLLSCGLLCRGKDNIILTVKNITSFTNSKIPERKIGAEA